MQAMKPYERQAVLYRCVQASKMTANTWQKCSVSKLQTHQRRARRDAALIDTFRIAAEEAVRIDGAIINLEVSTRAAGYHGFVRRFPVGPCGFISPFNFPLNLVAHKVAPAIAVGCPFILKPATHSNQCITYWSHSRKCRSPERSFLDLAL